MHTTEPETGSVGPLREALVVCAAAGMSGVLRVTGDPGGAIHLADGRVVAVETPGAPGPEVILLRSNRLTRAGWDAAVRAASASGGRVSRELVTRQVTGAGELEALLRTALADAMFALASGTVAEYRAEPGPAGVVLPVEPGAEPGALLAEASRRIQVLSLLPAPGKDDQLMAAPGSVRPGVRLGDGQDEILALADGGRTARDLAFTLGRGIYATMLQLARMRQAGLLVTDFQGLPPTAGVDPGHPGSGGRSRPELRALFGLLRSIKSRS
jgi:hypothetical protein